MLKFVKCVLLTLAFAVLPATALAQAISPAMLEQFRMLPRAEQERLALQYGIDPAMLQQSVGSSTTLVEQNSPVQSLTQPRMKSDLLAEQQLAEQKKSTEPQRFGLNLFDANISTFAPVSVMPVPDNYILGVDDQLKLQLFGKQNSELTLTVSREGSVFIADVGPIVVAGLSFNQARELITSKVRQAMIGVDAAVSMGTLRTINIFVVGEAKYPGAYAVSALTTVTQAMFVAGGVSDIGSLREITVKRAGNTVSEFDLYDLLLKGDNRGDIHLQNGDVVFIAPVKALAEVKGEVKRPALYELKAKDTLADLLAMAGGASAGAYPRAAVLERFDNNLRSLQNLDLTQPAVKQQRALNGDVLRIAPTSGQIANQIVVAGAVARPGFYAWQSDIRFTDLIRHHWSDLLPSADLNYALVVREATPGTITDLLHFSPAKALAAPGSCDDVVLAPRDKVLVFHYADQSVERSKLNRYLRDTILEKIDENIDQRWLMSDLSANALDKVQVTEQPPSLITEADPNAQMLDNSAQPLTKQQQDELLLNELKALFADIYNNNDKLQYSPQLSRTELLYPILKQLQLQSRVDNNLAMISVTGAVRVPGEYPLTRGAKVADLINAAGGLNDATYISRAELSRTLRHNTQLNGIDVKHINLNLQQALNGGDDNIALQNRDRLNVFSTPGWQDKREVVIEGEVRFPGTYIIQQGETLSQVIARAGGVTNNAFVYGSVFTREQVKEKEIMQYAKLVEQLKSDVATRALSAERSNVSPNDAMRMIKELEKIQPLGRLVVDLEQVMAANPAFDLVVEHGDRLFVPRTNRAITVLGEVQHAGTHRFDASLSLQQYLELAGGLRKRADDERTYVIRADGSVMVPTNSWFSVSRSELKPGDTIIVPLDTEYKDSLSLWSQVTQIFYQTAITIAALNSF
ncbi:MAG: SLBB domain-containing protein [Pseudomonadota bacterium]